MGEGFEWAIGHAAYNVRPTMPPCPLRDPLFSRQCQSASLATHLKLFSKQCPSASRARFHNGARRRNRTANILLTGQALYLLSYTGKNSTPSTSLVGAAERFSRGAGHSACNAPNLHASQASGGA